MTKKQTKLNRDMLCAFEYAKIDEFLEHLDQGGDLNFLCPDSGHSLWHLLWAKAPLEFIYYVFARTSQSIDMLQKDEFGELPSHYTWRYGDAIHCDIFKADVVHSLENCVAAQKGLPPIHDPENGNTSCGTYEYSYIDSIFAAGFRDKWQHIALYDFEEPTCQRYAHPKIQYMIHANETTNLKHLTNSITKHPQ